MVIIMVIIMVSSLKTCVAAHWEARYLHHNHDHDGHDGHDGHQGHLGHHNGHHPGHHGQLIKDMCCSPLESPLPTASSQSIKEGVCQYALLSVNKWLS